jgi:hypothetical protein
MSLDKEPRWLPIGPLLFLFVCSAGYGIAALIAWLVLGGVMPVEAWPGIVLAAAGVLLVLYAPSKPANQQAEAP